MTTNKGSKKAKGLKSVPSNQTKQTPEKADKSATDRVFGQLKQLSHLLGEFDVLREVSKEQGFSDDWFKRVIGFTERTRGICWSLRIKANTPTHENHVPIEGINEVKKNMQKELANMYKLGWNDTLDNFSVKK